MLVEDELEVLCDEDVADVSAEVDVTDALDALTEDCSADVEESELVGGLPPMPTRPARSGLRFLTIRPTSTWSRR